MTWRTPVSGRDDGLKRAMPRLEAQGAAEYSVVSMCSRLTVLPKLMKGERT